MTTKSFAFGHDHLTVSIALGLLDHEIEGVLLPEILSRIRTSATLVEDIAGSDEVVYGINTGFGPLCNTRISAKDTIRLQDNILRSHDVGVGEPITRHLSKLMLILKVHALAKGFSGVSLRVVQRLLWFINNDIIPVVPKQGSVGASGDLAPLAHLVLPLIGLGKVWVAEEKIETATLYQQHELQIR